MIEELIDMYYYQQGNKKPIDDYIYYTDKIMGDKILVSPKKVGYLRNILLNNNYVNYIRKGNPCKGHYKINFDQIEKDIKTNFSLSKTKIEDQNKSEIIQSNEPNQFPEIELTGSSISVEQDGTLRDNYIEKERIEKEKIENERTTNERIENNDIPIEINVSNKKKYDKKVLNEIFDIMYGLYPRSFNKEYCLNIFMNIPEIYEEVYNILDLFEIQYGELNNIKYDENSIPTFSSYLRSKLWVISAEKLINYHGYQLI